MSEVVQSSEVRERQIGWRNRLAAWLWDLCGEWLLENARPVWRARFLKEQRHEAQALLARSGNRGSE